MRSLVYAGPRQLEWREVPEPVLDADHQALVRPIASAACDLDRRIVAGATPMQGPFAIGHEAVGEVLEVGDVAAASGLRPGMRVVIPWHLSCGACAQCLARRPGNCTSTPHLASYGTPLGGHHGGLFDDVVRVPWASYALVPLPSDLAPSLAVSCSDQMTDAYRAVAPTLTEHPGASVLVVGGTASLGLWVVMFAAALGAGEVVYADTDPEAAALARTLGATRTIVGEIPDRVEGEFALAVDVGGQAERTLACALRSVAPGGTAVGRCIYFGAPPVPYWDLYTTGVSFVTGLPHATPFVAEVIDLLRSGAADPRAVFSEPLPYNTAPEALLEPPRKPVFVRAPRHPTGDAGP